MIERESRIDMKLHSQGFGRRHLFQIGDAPSIAHTICVDGIPLAHLPERIAQRTYGVYADHSVSIPSMASPIVYSDPGSAPTIRSFHCLPQWRGPHRD